MHDMRIVIAGVAGRVLFCALGAALASVGAHAQQPAPPAWKQGQPASMATSALAPHAAPLTVTPVEKIPIDKLKAPAGFKVEMWAHGMPGARMMTRGDKGTLFVGTRAAGKVYAVTDKDGTRTHKTIAEGLVQPNGLAFKDGALYVVTVDKVLRYDGIEDKLDAPQATDLTEKFGLPPSTHHNWKFARIGPDNKLYFNVGAPCNICEVNPGMYAQIRRHNLDGSGMEIVARGVRNSVGFDWHPVTKELWFTDHGRDWAGDDSPQDELNRLPADSLGANFGFPYCHANGITDPDIKRPNACAGVILPAALTGPHSAGCGMRFYTGSMFPAAYKNQAFIARRGSWNRTKKFGFDVVAVKVNGGRATLAPFLTGFLDPQTDTFWGRPVDVQVQPDGSLLVSDEQNGAIYRVSHAGRTAAR